MLKHIIAIILLTVNVQFSPCVAGLVKDESDVSVSSIFEVIGYSPVCVASALASCEYFAKPDGNSLIPELKSLLQNITCENKAISVPENTSVTEEIKMIVNELKTHDLEQNVAINELNVAIKTIIENVTTFHNDLLIIKETVESVSVSNNNFSNIILNEIKQIHNELKSLKEKRSNDASLEETLLDEVKNSSSEILYVHGSHQHCAEDSVTDGVTTVYPYKENDSKGVQTYCDQTTDGGGWMVIQNRDSDAIRQNFTRPWSDYVEGFGDVEGEFWLGLENIHALAELTPMELRVDLEDNDGVKKWAKYDSFKIGDASTKYVLTLGNYSGDAGDSLAWHNGMKFSTYDQDNDEDSTINCALTFKGGWWFRNFTSYCLSSNLNGYQHVGKQPLIDHGIQWNHFRGWDYSLKKASMKIRPKSSN